MSTPFDSEFNTIMTASTPILSAFLGEKNLLLFHVYNKKTYVYNVINKTWSVWSNTSDFDLRDSVEDPQSGDTALAINKTYLAKFDQLPGGGSEPAASCYIQTAFTNFGSPHTLKYLKQLHILGDNITECKVFMRNDANDGWTSTVLNDPVNGVYTNNIEQPYREYAVKLINSTGLLTVKNIVAVYDEYSVL